MKKRNIAMLVSTTTIAAVALVAFGAHFERPLLGSAYDSNTVSITRADRERWVGNYDASTVTAITEKGNQLQFGAENFDIRNGGGNWNDCVVFDASRGDSIFWNKTELYGITSIKIFSYNKDNPDSYANLCGQSFIFYYGYEQIDFDDEYYVAKETTTSGMIEFDSGYEPSYFGIKANFSNDICVSKIEINYLCEQVEGEFITSGTEARLYESVTKSFKYTSGNTVLVREEAAPLGRETAALEHAKGAWYNEAHPETASNYDPATHSWTPLRDDHLTIDRADSQAFAGRKGRNTMVVTLMLSKAEGFTGWSGASDFYIGVNRSASETKCQSRVYTQNPTAGAQSWVFLADGFEIYDAATGHPMTTPIWDIKVVVEFDVSSVENIYNFTVGTSNAHQTFTIYDISFRDNCAHTAGYDDFSTGYSFGHKCHRCGRVIDDNFVTTIDYHNYSGKSSDNFKYQTDVTFNNVDHCLKTITAIKTNDSDGGWSQNYQLRLAGLIANARTAGLTTIKFKFYIESATNFNTRLQWGLWNNSTSKIEDFALLDHYNGPTNAGYDSNLAVSMVTSVTKLDGTPAGETGKTNASYANQWSIMTIDVSDSGFANLELFFSPAVDNNGAGTYPINVYIADLQCL